MKPPPRVTNLAFVLVLLVVTACTSLSPPSPTPNLAGNPIWNQFQPKLGRIVDSFERSCRSQGQDFDRRAVESELRSCFGAPMNELVEIVTGREPGATVQLVTIVEKIKPQPGTNTGPRATGSITTTTTGVGVSSLTLAEVELLRAHIVEPICFYSSKILDCFAPYYNRILERCTSDPEGKAMQYSDQIVIAACRNNGSRLIDFLETGGLECVDQYYSSALDCLNNQSMSFSDSMDLLKYKRTPDSVSELCGDLTEMHSCLTSSVGTCRRAEPARLMRTALDEIHEWTLGVCRRGAGSDKEAAHAYSDSGRVTGHNWGFCIAISLILTYFSGAFI